MQGEEGVKEGLILLYYKYVHIADPSAMVEWQRALCTRLNMTGKIRIAEEGINGTVGGSVAAAREYQREMEAHPSGVFSVMEWKQSPGSAKDFETLSVKLVSELVALGIPGDKVLAAGQGKHLEPEEFHAVLEKPPNNLYLLDCRNFYEGKIGKFAGAVVPPVRKFASFPAWVDEHLEEMKNKEVLMYCTGGIRCEYGSAYLKLKGIENVYQLHGGIHKYIEKYPDGFFRGKNYVFDGRQSIAANSDILSNCELCGVPWDYFRTCASNDCYTFVLACDKCFEKNGGNIYCCEECKKAGATWTKKLSTKEKGKPRKRKERKREKKELIRLLNKQKRELELLADLERRLTELENGDDSHKNFIEKKKEEATELPLPKELIAEDEYQ